MTKLFYKSKKAVYLIKQIFNFRKSKNSIISNFVETKKEYHIAKLDLIHDQFYRVLFEQIVSCSLIDTEDFFSNQDQSADILFKDMNTFESSYLEKFEKHMIMYHVIKFLQKNSCDVDVAEINKIILTKFDFKSADKDRFGKFFNRSQNTNDNFESLFVHELCRNVFYTDNISLELYGYISGFLNQCHESFISSYTKYVSIDTTTELLSKV